MTILQSPPTSQIGRLEAQMISSSALFAIRNKDVGVPLASLFFQSSSHSPLLGSIREPLPTNARLYSSLYFLSLTSSRAYFPPSNHFSLLPSYYHSSSLSFSNYHTYPTALPSLCPRCRPASFPSSKPSWCQVSSR